ncbi:AfsR/SARP family transcriptional regulator [Micromonospora endolithica]|uniref:Activator protein n=1 Tax=Micromonospora endolithica TaxID=230091 RepID=A0A3A9ZQN1_9ACTN|nr:AfsR/SARP family transcriptional regulator [Micromonospora endolithica]RKN50254.1 activator protein [Micromonospora endolithica]TWJ21105.1 DNA-binding SARP family transcriptional activator [Micromonospora endolithica]
MRYEVLGPLRVTDGGTHTSISAQKIETVLSVLLIRSDQIVALSQLMDEIWGEDLPHTATAGLHVYISQLRKFLRRPDRPDNPIVTRPPGYLLRRGTDEIDFHIFQQLVNQGRSSMRQQQHEEAMYCFEDALRLWRGPVLGDLRGGYIVDSFVTHMAEARLECQEMLAEAQLVLGHHRELVGRLYPLVAENPLYEAFYRQLMLALYRSERQADALKVYQTARSTLREELGLEPCQALRDLQRAILAADGRLQLNAA